MSVPKLFLESDRASLIELIASSYEHWFARSLVASGDSTVASLWHAPFAILAHGIEADPLFFFASKAALDRFGYSPDEIVGLPSRLSAEPPQRGNRRRMLERVARDGYIDDYAGLRITASGERFRIDRAAVWTVIDKDGARVGQAARFTV